MFIHCCSFSIFSSCLRSVTLRCTSSTAAGTQAPTEADEDHHAGDQDLGVREDQNNPQFENENSYPFNDENNKGIHHWLVSAVVLVLCIRDILVVIIGPACPGTKHNNRTLLISV
jgi:hypothetical protein